MYVYVAQTNQLTVVGVCEYKEQAAKRLRGVRLVDDRLGGWEVFDEDGKEVGLVTIHEVRAS